MRFYVSWYPGDPYYPLYDSDCSLLVSISSVSREWAITNFPKHPRYLMVDSGGFRYAKSKYSNLLPSKNLERQLAIIADSGISSIICALDYPLLDTSLDSNRKDRNLNQTIAFAYEFKNLFAKKNIPQNIIPMAIIQGENIDTFSYCAHELKSIEFPLYGIGSLALLRDHQKIIERIQSVIPIIGAGRLHVFGINAINTVISLRKLGIHSIDSARAAKAAAYNEVLYSKPFRRFGILENSGTEIKGRIPLARRLAIPIPCDCPACSHFPNQILGVGKREYIRLRTLHNYYHLKQAFNGE